MTACGTQRQRRWWRHSGLVVWLLILALCSGAQRALADGAGNADVVSGAGCMEDVAGFGLNCTANDIQIASVTNLTILDDGCAFYGDTVTFSADFEVLLTAQARHDIGLWFAEDGDPNGDGAVTGTCTVATPAYAPDPPWLDLDGTGDTFLNTNVVSNIQDTCGDIDNVHSPLFPTVTLTVQCVDSDGDGQLNLPNCTSWKQPGDNDLCTGPLPVADLGGPGLDSSGVPPGSPSKCRCDPGFQLPINVPPAELEVEKSALPASVDEPGGLVTFQVRVTNVSNTTGVTLDVLEDDIYGNLADPANPLLLSTTCSLPQTLVAEDGLPGGADTYVCTFSAEVSGNAGDSETDTVTASGTDDNGTPITGSASATVTVTDVLPSIDLTKLAEPDQISEPGDWVTFTFTVVNLSAAEAVTIDSLLDSLYGDLNGQGTCSVPQVLAPAGQSGDSYSCSIEVFVDGNAGDLVLNEATAYASDDDGNTAMDLGSETVTVLDVPSEIQIVKTALPSNLDEPGGSVTFTFVVTNLSLADTVVLDSLVDSVYGDLTLVAGSTCAVPQTLLPEAGSDTYSCSITVDLFGNAGDAETNVATAYGTDDDGVPVMDDDSATVTINDVPPTVTLEKTAAPTSLEEPGGDFTFTLTITNASAEAVTLTDLGDSQALQALDFTACSALVGTTLAPAGKAGDTATCSYVVPHADAGAYTNTATVAVEDNDGSTAVASDSETVTVLDLLPDISVLKTASPTSLPEPGGSVTFTFLVTNHSSEAVQLDSLVDDTFGDLNGQGDCALPQAIAGGGSYSCVVSQVLGGQAFETHTNVVTATASDDDGNFDTASDDETVSFTDVPAAIEVLKTATPDTVEQPGGTVTFNILVNNLSAVDAVTIDSLTDTIYGDLNGQGDCSLPQAIAVGGSYSCSFAAFVTVTETNVVTASGLDDDGFPVSDDDAATVTVLDVAPEIDLTKSASPTSVPETGGDVTFTFTVNNIGQEDATLTSLSDSVFGDLNGQGDCATGGLIPIGGSYSCSITVFLSGDDLAAHYDLATATVVDDDGTPAEASDDETVTFLDVAPQIDLTKSASPASVPETGGDVTFTFTVNNIGQEDATLTSLSDSVFGDLNGQGDCVVPQSILIGGSYSCSVTVFLSGDDLAAHYDLATATVVDDDGTPAEASDDETVIFLDVAPEIDLTKSASPTSVPETGGDVQFTIVVTNHSLEDATIDSLVDSDFDLATKCPDAVGTLLASGASYSCIFTEYVTGDYTGPAHEDTATVVASDNDGNSDTASDEATVTFTDVLPAVSITKAASQTQVFAPGEDVTFTIVVTNDGLEDAIIDSLVDSVFDLASRCPDAVGTLLVSGGSYTCSFTELVAADHENTATVVAADDDGNTDTDAATAMVEMVDPSIDIEKSTNGYDADTAPGPEILVGSTVTWDYLVYNDGDVDLLDVTVTDSVLGDVCTVDFLAAGGSATCTLTGTAAPGQYANAGTASVHYTDADGDSATRTDVDNSHYFGAAPSVAIDKKTADAYGNEGDSLGILPGETVTWYYRVTNDGNVALENVSVSDDQGVVVACPQDTLAVGETMTCTASGVAMEGWYDNVGTAYGDYADDAGNAVTVTAADASSYYGLMPGSVTNSSLCDFGEQFRLVFTPDKKNSTEEHPAYKLSDSNPGQFYYNGFYVNDGSATVVQLEIPYPYVTQGAMPVHVYDGVFIDPESTEGDNCLLPQGELASHGLEITLDSYTDTNGDGSIGFGDVYVVEVPLEPGFQYVNIHLDYGLEKTNGWLNQASDAVNDPVINPELQGITIYNGTSHVFQTYVDGMPLPGSLDTVYNSNRF